MSGGQPRPPSDGWAALDALPDPALVVDGAGVIVHANPLLVRLLGASADLRGRHAADAVPLVDEAGRDWWACRRPLDDDPAVRTRLPESQLTVTDAAGRDRPVLVTAARRAADDAALVLLLRRGERRLRLDAARSDLVSTVSHELRSPLTSVKGFVKTLLAKWDRFTDEQRRQMLATVDADADRVTRLLGELLDVSRIDAGRLQLRRSMIDLDEVAQRVVDRQRTVHRDADVRLELGPLPQLYADADRLEQVLTNLVENAVKHGDGPVTLTAETDDERVTVSVADRGPGVAEADVPQLFSKFFQTAGARRSGTGLGLYICRGIVEAHGGRIWAEPREGGGAAFRFTLPRGGLELAGVPGSVPTTSDPEPDARDLTP